MGWFDDLLKIEVETKEEKPDPNKKDPEPKPDTPPADPGKEGTEGEEEKVTSDAPLFPKSKEWEDFKAKHKGS